VAHGFEAARQSNQTVMQWYGWTLPVEVAPAIQERFGAEVGAGETGVARLDEFTRKMGRLCWPEERHFDYQVTSQAIRCIEEAATEARPFMVTCSLNNPHDPNVVPDPYYRQFDPAAIELPPSFAHCGDHHRTCVSRARSQRLGEAGVREFLRIYYAQVAMVDHQVQRLLDALDRCGVGEHTLVIFASGPRRHGGQPRDDLEEARRPSTRRSCVSRCCWRTPPARSACRPSP